MTYGIMACFVLALVSADQLTKYFAALKLKPIGSITIIDNFFYLTFVENRGAAFGIFQGGRWFLVIFTILLLLGLVFYHHKLSKPPHKYGMLLHVSFLLIISGALGNFIDRLLKGFVIDFFHFGLFNFPVFNVADIFVVSGSILFAFMQIFVEDEAHESA